MRRKTTSMRREYWCIDFKRYPGTAVASFIALASLFSCGDEPEMGSQKE